MTTSTSSANTKTPRTVALSAKIAENELEYNLILAPSVTKLEYEVQRSLSYHSEIALRLKWLQSNGFSDGELAAQYSSTLKEQVELQEKLGADMERAKKKMRRSRMTILLSKGELRIVEADRKSVV